MISGMSYSSYNYSCAVSIASSSMSVSVSIGSGIKMLVNVHISGQPCSLLSSALLYLIEMQALSCLSLAVEYVDLSLVLSSQSELVYCKVVKDRRLLVMLDSLVAGDMGFAGRLLTC